MALNVDQGELNGFRLFRLRGAVDRNAVSDFVDKYLKELLTDGSVKGVLFNSAQGDPCSNAILELINITKRLAIKQVPVRFVPQKKLLNDNPIWINRYAKLGLGNVLQYEQMGMIP